MKNRALAIFFALAATSGLAHLPDDINFVVKTIKNHNRENTFNKAFESVAARGSRERLNESGCSEANTIYQNVLSDSHYKLFRGAIEVTGARFYSACLPLIK